MEIEESAEWHGISVEEVRLQMFMGFMHSQEQNLIASDAVCEVWSPYDAFDAAQTMLEVLTGFQAISLGTSQLMEAEASDMCYKPEPGNE